MENEVNIENDGMTDEEFNGLIKMIIKMLEDDIPKEKMIEYLEELIEK